ncbi:MAG: T9SS type A sorting domain-containing protein [Chitinophagales bacterium]|nr:T9SS type A sorting domain-containing protein [Chitinophagales bacterium]
MKTKLLSLGICMFLVHFTANTQCSLTTNDYGSNPAPPVAGWWEDISYDGGIFSLDCNWAGEYATMTGGAANTDYAIASDAGTSPTTYVTVYNPSNVLVSGAYGNVHNSGIVNFTSNTAGDYKVQVTTGYPSCGTDATCRHIFAIGVSSACDALASLRDGSFEQSAGSIWSETVITSGTTYAIVDTQLPLTGSQSAWLGGYGQTSDTYVQQTLTFPNGGTLKLYLWLLLGICDSASDVFTVEVDGNVVYTQYATGTNCGDDTWHLKSIDLSSYANGASHTVRIRGKEFAVNGGNTNFFVDDVTLEHCSTPPTYDCPALMLNIGDPCNDGNPNTNNDTVNASCQCVGTPVTYDCPALSLNIGDPCDDGNANTVNDMVNASCQCVGTFTGTCEPDYTLIGTETATADYETNGQILTLQVIETTATVDYDSGTKIDLLSGFWAKAGCTLAAFIDGCNGSGGVLSEKPETVNQSPDAFKAGTDKTSRPAKYSGSNLSKTNANTSSKISTDEEMLDARKLRALGNLELLPNPAANETTLQYELPQTGNVELKVIDVQGRILKQINLGNVEAKGLQQYKLETNDLPNGVYNVIINTEYNQLQKRLVISK